MQVSFFYQEKQVPILRSMCKYLLHKLHLDDMCKNAISMQFNTTFVFFWRQVFAEGHPRHAEVVALSEGGAAGSAPGADRDPQTQAPEAQGRSGGGDGVHQKTAAAPEHRRGRHVSAGPRRQPSPRQKYAINIVGHGRIFH